MEPATEPATAPKLLSAKQAKEALKKILAEFNNPDVVQAIMDAKEAAGADVNNIVVEVVPMFFEIQGKVMMEYGYAPDDEGFGAFGESLKTNEGSDEEYDKLAGAMKAFMKKMTTPDTPADE